MPSQGVVNRRRVGQALIATARTCAHDVGDRLTTHLAAVLDDGETLPDFTHLQDLLVRLLETRLEALVAADTAARAVRRVAPETREARNRALAGLYRTVRDLRAGFAGLFGHDGGGRLLGVGGATAEYPPGLLSQARRVLERLREPLPELPDRVPGIEVECAAVADHLRPEVETLDRAVAAVERVTDEQRAAVAARAEAVEAFDRVLGGIGRVVQGFAVLADRPTLGRRIRFGDRYARELAAGESAPSGPAGPPGAARTSNPANREGE